MAFLDNFFNKRKNTSENPPDKQVDTSFVDAQLGEAPIGSSISDVLVTSRGGGKNHPLENKLEDKKFREKITKILKHHNIDIADYLRYGGFSWVLDIGEGQMLHISSPSSSKGKQHIRYNEPEILQPLAYLYYGDDLKIEVLPKVKTEGVTKEHVDSLVSSLAKKGLLFADCDSWQIGLITLDGKEEIPVVIGDGCVVKMDERGLNANDYKRGGVYKGVNIEGNSRWFSFVVSKNFPELVEKYKDNPEGLIDYFKNNDKYIHHDWGNREDKETWAQNKFAKAQGLERNNGDGQYRIKGTIHSNTISKLEAIKDKNTPITNKFIDAITLNCLRKKDVETLAAGVAAHIVNERGGDMVSFTKFLEERTKSENKR